MLRFIFYTAVLIALFSRVGIDSLHSQSVRAMAVQQIPSNPSDSNAWKEFISQEGRFAVLMPGTPKEDTQKTSTILGQIDMHMFFLQTSEAVYIASYADFPITELTPELVEKMLEGARANILANNELKLLTESKIALNGFPGRELNIEVPGGFLRTKFYIANRRMHQIIIVMPGADKNSPQAVKNQDELATKFLGSLKIMQADTKKL